MTDNTLWADVSYYQPAVDNSYPYKVLAFRANDGTYQDPKFHQNYQWACAALDSGRLSVAIIYLVYRPNWQQTLDTLKSMVGQPHSNVVFMIDVESWGGQIRGDNSDGINKLYWGITDWIGTTKDSGTRRVIGYLNPNDASLWPTRPPGIRLVIPGYGANPSFPGKIAHQYTDGNGYGGGLPEGAPPFGKCDMNSADGLSVSDFAAAVGLNVAPPVVVPPNDGGQVDPRILAAALQWCKGWSANEITYTANDPAAENWGAAMLVVTSSILTNAYKSRVAGSTYNGTLSDFILNTDAAAYRTEQAVADLTAQVAALTALVKGQSK